MEVNKEVSMARMKMKAVACAVVCMSAAAWAFPSPQLSGVTTSVKQGPRATVIVSYHVSEPAIVLCDVMTNVTDDVYASIGPEHQLTFIGDVGRRVEAGDRRFTWKAGADWPSNQVSGIKVKLTAYPPNRPPPYLVVDLAPDTPERYRYYASADAIPGFPESDLYRTQKLVMKFIRAKNIPWTMGSYAESSTYSADNEHVHEVRLRSNYWMAVFEMTVGQKAWFTDGSATAKANTLPLCRESTYNTVRGTDLYPAAPSETSYLGMLYNRTSIRFDLPSESQWEYAAKAGHGEGLWGDGTEMTEFNLTNGIGQAVYKYSEGVVTRVGSHKPNSWGLYDMMGSVKEGCLDWYQKDISWNTNGMVNANGANLADGTTAGTHRVCRGNYYSGAAGTIRPAYRYGSQKPNEYIDGFGWRVMTMFGLD